MRIIYPFNPLHEKEADDPYQEEYALLSSQGVNCSLFDFDTLDFNEFKPKPGLSSGETILYRGWMLNLAGYQQLVTLIKRYGAVPLTSMDNYVKCHHLPNWYEACSEYTAESRFFPFDDDLGSHVDALGWTEYFVKDFVKSNSTERGSIASSADEVVEIARLIQDYRGEVEGGVVVRRVESYDDTTETRYFVWNGKVYSPNGDVPDLALKIADCVNAPFFSMDLIMREDGVSRLVEIGDGQVSDKKHWGTQTFASMILDNI